VLHDGEGEAKGLQVGDFVLCYAGQAIMSLNGFLIEVNRPGDESRELVMLRDGKEVTLRVPPGRLNIRAREISK